MKINTENQAWNPRFSAYALSKGHQPQEQLNLDREEWAGGCMTGFILWLQARLDEWREQHKGRRDEFIIANLLSDHAQSEFNRFLFDRAIEMLGEQ